MEELKRCPVTRMPYGPDNYPMFLPDGHTVGFQSDLNLSIPNWPFMEALEHIKNGTSFEYLKDRELHYCIDCASTIHELGEPANHDRRCRVIRNYALEELYNLVDDVLLEPRIFPVPFTHINKDEEHSKILLITSPWVWVTTILVLQLRLLSR